MPRARNTQGKRRTHDDPYEVWRSFDGLAEWRVLKKYQAPHKEAENQYARWYCSTKGDGTFGQYELGDEYVRRIKAEGYKVEGEGRP
jgi:hypothetical protein